MTRAFEAGDEDLELLVFSPRAEGDAEIVEDFLGLAATRPLPQERWRSPSDFAGRPLVAAT